ncbi:hypothetical protein EJB05_00809, partial [Eragrostis curvula]
MARLEKRRRISTAVSIPDDLLISEVLVRLPVKSLARFRSVCRSWRAGIADPAFVRRHRDLSRATARCAPSVLAIPREVDPDDEQATSGDISFHRLLPGGGGNATKAGEMIFEKAWPGGITRLIFPAHCDGLVAVATTTDHVFVCNPATREFAALPPGSHDARLDHCDLLVPPVAVGHDPWRNAYVVARCFYRRYGRMRFEEATGTYAQDYDIGHEVLTLAGGEPRRWEATQDPPHAVDGVHRPICTRRAFYWHGGVARPRLMRFSLHHRTFDVVPRPPTGYDTADDMASLMDGFKLCYVHALAAASFQVWLADDGAKLEWSLLCRIDLADPLLPNLSYAVTPLMMNHGAGHQMLLLAINGSKLCRYDVRNKVLDQVMDTQHELPRADTASFFWERYVVPYAESLVSPTATKAKGGPTARVTNWEAGTCSVVEVVVVDPIRVLEHVMKTLHQLSLHNRLVLAHES